MTKNIVIILAGGSGTRFGGELPKQFVMIAGKSIIEHTISIFQNAKIIDEIAVVINKNYKKKIESIVEKNNFTKVKKIIQGGADRAGSSISAINAYEDAKKSENINLIFHDAVRLFVSEAIIDNVVDALKNYNAVGVAIPVTNTIFEVKEKKIQNIPNREYLQQAQTPQAFNLSVIKKAYEKAKNDENFVATDDCGVVNKYLPNEQIYLVAGDETNIKITYELDIFVAEKVLETE